MHDALSGLYMSSLVSYRQSWEVSAISNPILQTTATMTIDRQNGADAILHA